MFISPDFFGVTIFIPDMFPFLCFCRDPLPVPVKERKPLTEVQAFALHVDQRSSQRQEFDNKVASYMYLTELRVILKLITCVVNSFFF